MTSIEKTILGGIAHAEDEIGLTVVPAWQHWAIAELETLKAYGPRYRPGEMFNGGNAMPDRARVAYLRTVHDLAGRGMLDLTSENGRLKHVRTTPAGRTALEADVPVSPIAPAGDTPLTPSTRCDE